MVGLKSRVSSKVEVLSGWPGRGPEEASRKERQTEKLKLSKAQPALSTPSQRSTIPSATNSYLPTSTSLRLIAFRVATKHVSFLGLK